MANDNIENTNSDAAELALSRSVAKATGRKAALAVIDRIMGDTNNIKVFAEEMQARFDADPYEFFKQIVMPLTPKQTQMGMDEEEKGKININIVYVNKPELPQSSLSNVVEGAIVAARTQEAELTASATE